MAITLNKNAALCEKMALADDKISPTSSSRVSLYDISVKWRKLHAATVFRQEDMPWWSEKEVAAAEIMLATMIYLRRIGCRDIEQLLRDTIQRGVKRKE